MVVSLPTKDNAKLLQQLKSGFKRTLNWNKYQSKITNERQHQYLDYLIDPSFPRAREFLFYHLKIMRLEQDTHDIFFRK